MDWQIIVHMTLQEIFLYGGMRFAPARHSFGSVLCILVLCLQPPLLAQVVINEIMFAPRSPEPEWVELYNSDSVAHTLENIYLHDANSRVLIPKLHLEAGAFAILCKDSAALRSQRLLPSEAQIVKLNIPSLNNSGEALFLQTKDSVSLDSLTYSDSLMTPGRSIERIDAKGLVRDFMNLKACQYSDGASCGFANSVAFLELDIGISSIEIDSQAQRVRVVCKNMSRGPCNESTLLVRVDSTSFEAQTLQQLQRGESFIWVQSLENIQTLVNHLGRCSLRASLSMSGDQRRVNDTASMLLRLSPARQSLRINEVHFDPLHTQCEFVELYNASDQELDLQTMLFCDGSGGTMRIDSTCILTSMAYMAFSRDSTFFERNPQLISKKSGMICSGNFTLRSTEDQVVLRDSYLKCIDSLAYLSSWHSGAAAETKGKSLEKVSPLLRSDLPWSWTTCTDTSGITPGAVNSVAREVSSAPELSASPNPFSPRSVLGSRQSTVIRVRLSTVQSRVLVRVFDVEGRCVREIENGLYVGSDFQVLWDGRNAAGFCLPVGAYIVSVESTDLISLRTELQTLVIALGE